MFWFGLQALPNRIRAMSQCVILMLLRARGLYKAYSWREFGNSFCAGLIIRQLKNYSLVRSICKQRHLTATTSDKAGWRQDKKFADAMLLRRQRRKQRRVVVDDRRMQANVGTAPPPSIGAAAGANRPHFSAWTVSLFFSPS